MVTKIIALFKCFFNNLLNLNSKDKSVIHCDHPCIDNVSDTLYLIFSFTCLVSIWQASSALEPRRLLFLDSCGLFAFHVYQCMVDANIAAHSICVTLLLNALHESNDCNKYCLHTRTCISIVLNTFSIERSQEVVYFLIP